MDVYSQLRKAQVELLASDPATAEEQILGRIIYNTTSNVLKVWTGAAWEEQADLNSAQTLANKTLTSPTINTPTIDQPTINNEQILQELASTPATPAAGYKKLYPKTDGLVYTLDDNGNEVPIGSGGGSGTGFKNYLAEENSTFDLIETAWAVYNDGNAIPTGALTGGSPSGNLTAALTEVVGEVLAKDRSLKVSKAAVSTVGEGVSVLTENIDLIDRGKRLVFSISKKVLSGSYVGGDLKLYAYDVTNSAYLSVTSDLDIDISSADGTQEFFVQTEPTTESVRIGLHVASVNASAYELSFDEIGLLRKDVIIPNQISAGRSYSPTLAGANSFSNEEFSYIDFGTRQHVEGYFVPSTTNTSLARMTLPNGNTAKDVGFNGNTTKQIGYWYKDIAANPSEKSGPIITEANSNSVWFVTDRDDGANSPYTKQQGSFIFSSGSGMFVKFDLEVNELGNNVIEGLVQTSQLGFMKANSTVAQTIPNSSQTKLLFENTLQDSRGNFSSSTYTADKQMEVDVIASVSYVANGTGFREIYIIKNGSIVHADAKPASAVVAGVSHDISAALSLNVGDTLEIHTFQNSGGNLDTINIGTSNYFHVSEKAFSQTAIIGMNKTAYIVEELSSGTNGGSSIAGEQTRALNTIAYDPFNLVKSLSSNVLTLGAGRYEIEIRTPCYRGNAHKAYLLDNTLSTRFVTGSSAYAEGASNVQTDSVGSDEVVLTSDQSFILRHFIQSAITTNGLGRPTSAGVVPERYSSIKITKVG
jgi:hypothetical protein